MASSITSHPCHVVNRNPKSPVVTASCPVDAIRTPLSIRMPYRAAARISPETIW